MRVETCKFVKWSDLMVDIPEEAKTSFEEWIGRNITWGDANKTLVDLGHIYDLVDEDSGSEDDPDCKWSNEIKARIESIPEYHQVYVDLEN